MQKGTTALETNQPVFFGGNGRDIYLYYPLNRDPTLRTRRDRG